MTDLEKAQQIVDDFKPTEEPGNKVVYIFLGKITACHEIFRQYNGKTLQADWDWVIDQTQLDSICYVGMGKESRAYASNGRSIYVDIKNRLIMKKDLSNKDAKLLEKELIRALGRYLKNGGSLANLWLGSISPTDPIMSELNIARRQHDNDRKIEGRKVAATNNIKPVVVCDFDKVIIATGSQAHLSKIYACNIGELLAKRRGLSQVYSPVLGIYIYACYKEDFQTFVPTKASRRQPGTKDKIIQMTHVVSGASLSGTARDLGNQLSIPSDRIHNVANPNYPNIQTTAGWSATYI